MKNKKGISPLIATVLVIGFTIVLAALVMQWGGGLFQDIQESTAKTSEANIACTTKLNGLEISANYDGTNLNFIADNKNDLAIEGFKMRLYDINNNVVDSGDLIMPMESYGRVSTPNPDPNGVDTLTDYSTVKKVEVFPQILVGDEVITCQQEKTVNVV